MKQKSIILFILLIGFMNVSQAQEKSADNIQVAEMYGRMYNLANKFNDPAVARVALYHILMFSPEKGKVLDSLALYYFNFQQWSSTALVAKENLNFNPDNEIALELAAISLENLGVKDQSLDYYEKLFLKNDDTNTLYRIAFLQYGLNRFKESLTSIDILLKRSDVDVLKFVFPKVDKTEQEVVMRAAIINLKGLITQQQGNIQGAKELFLEALKISPGFEIAQINLRDTGK